MQNNSQKYKSFPVCKRFFVGTFYHFIKIAIRNLLRYKNNTLINVIGLAVGFSCFAMSMLWIRYEMSFDNFHKNAKQIFVVYELKGALSNHTYYNRVTSVPLAAYLKETFPEIANSTAIVVPRFTSGITVVLVGGVEFPAKVIEVDSYFTQMFDVKILEGSRDFLVQGSQKIAITRNKSLQLFGNEDPIGKSVVYKGVFFTICAIISEMPKPSNYPYDFLAPIDDFSIIGPLGEIISDANQGWGIANANTIIELYTETDLEAFEKKLYEHEIIKTIGNRSVTINKLIIKPITKINYTAPDVARDIQFKFILIFALSCWLVVICALFNYFIFFVNHLHIRQKELALRITYGATRRSLFAMLLIEFMLVLLIAVAFSCVLIQFFHKPFMALSHIQMDLSAIYLKSLTYMVGVVIISLLKFLIIFLVFGPVSPRKTIHKISRSMFRKISIVVQIVISTGLTFCVVIILKQIYFLNHSNELGFSFNNQGSVSVSRNNGVAFANQLKQMPEIIEVIDTEGKMTSLLPMLGGISFTVRSWDDKPSDIESVSLTRVYVTPEYISFYDFRLIAGEMLTNADSESMVLINEDAARAFGWYDPVGKEFMDRYTVKGVIKNIYNRSILAVQPPLPSFFTQETRSGNNLRTVILFKYHKNTWKTLKPKIELLLENDDYNSKAIYNDEELFEKFLKSESAFIKIFSFVSALCILVCLFGFVSFVMLACKERRKEIAIRKINGATVGNIIVIFAKEFIILLSIGAAIAFTAGYFIMQRWLENYVIRTNIPAWIYLSIIFVFAFVIVIFAGWHVYKSSVENPAEVIKK